MRPHDEVLAVVDDYFAGIYGGDVERLAATFHPKAILGGEIKGQPYCKTVDEYLDGVRSRRSPSDLGEPFTMVAVGVEVHGEIALVKARLQMLGYDYVDFLSFVRLEGRWVIVAKVFTHLDGASISRP
jgi:hypothetical protein